MVEHTALPPDVSTQFPFLQLRALAPWRSYLQRLRASAPVVEYIAQLLQPRCSRDYGGVGAPFEDHVPRQAGCKTQSRNFGASLIVMTRMSRHSVVAPIPAAPLLTDTRRLTVGPGTREDLVVATVPVVAYFVPVCSIYVASASGVSGPVHYCVSACHGHCAVESGHASLRRFWSAAWSTFAWLG